MSGLTLTGVILTQLDKVILSRMLSLEMFGYYSLAGTVGRGLYVVITPIFNSIFPRLSALVAGGEESRLKEVYHYGSQLMAVLVLPLAVLVSLFSYDVILLWTGNSETASNTAPIASLLVIGTALNGLMNLPYALQLAHGWTRLGLYINIFFIVALVPLIIFMTLNYGAIGGASVWPMLNGVYMLIGVPLTHFRLLKDEGWRWLSLDVCLPLVATLMVLGPVRLLIDSPMSTRLTVITLSLALLSSILAAAMAIPNLRGLLRVQLERVVPA
jgi:O-antigen/teichoic acid export membrane protein